VRREIQDVGVIDGGGMWKTIGRYAQHTFINRMDDGRYSKKSINLCGFIQFYKILTQISYRHFSEGGRLK